MHSGTLTQGDQPSLYYSLRTFINHIIAIWKGCNVFWSPFDIVIWIFLIAYLMEYYIPFQHFRKSWAWTSKYFYHPRSGMVMVTFGYLSVWLFTCLILVGKKKTFGFYICHSLFLAALVYNLIFFSKISFEFLFKICYKNFNNLNLITNFLTVWIFFQFFYFLKEFKILLAKPRGW